MDLIARFGRQGFAGHVYVSDALELLGQMQDESADLVFLDPPFNLGKKYKGSNKSDRLPTEAYEFWLQEVANESMRVLKPGGALFLYHLPIWALKIGTVLLEQLELRHWIAVSMKNGFVRGKHLYPAHYALLYFTKGSPSVFARPRLKPVRCRHCGKVVKDYGGYWEHVKKRGLNLSDFWEDISPVRHAHMKTRDSNELPEKMVDRIVSIAGRKGRTFVDPFCGSGAATLAAARRGMKFVAGDISRTYARITAQKVRKTLG